MLFLQNRLNSYLAGLEHSSCDTLTSHCLLLPAPPLKLKLRVAESPGLEPTSTYTFQKQLKKFLKKSFQPQLQVNLLCCPLLSPQIVGTF